MMTAVVLAAEMRKVTEMQVTALLYSATQLVYGTIEINQHTNCFFEVKL